MKSDDYKFFKWELEFKGIRTYPVLIALLITMVFSQGVWAKSAGNTGFQFLRISPFARSSAMADAATAYVGDPMSLYINPAGLAHVSTMDLSAQHVSHFDDVSYSHVTFVGKFRSGGWGLGVGVLDVKDIPRTRTDSTVTDRFVETGTIDAGDTLVTFSWGRRQNRDLAIGVSLKVAQEKLDSESALAIMGDVGGIYRLERNWRAAVVLRHLGTTAQFVSEQFSPPSQLHGGVYHMQNDWLEWEFGGIFHLEGPKELVFGSELNWHKLVFFRLGYRRSSEDSDLGSDVGFSAGMGINVKGFRTDYAFLPYGDLGDSHRMTVSWRFK